MIDIPADCDAIASGACSDGVTARGKQAPAGPVGSRQGLNDYTGWFAGDADMAGDYLGYDGPFPPPNDLRLHRYFFRLFALDIATLSVPARFTAAAVQQAMTGHVQIGRAHVCNQVTRSHLVCRLLHAKKKNTE